MDSYIILGLAVLVAVMFFGLPYYSAYKRRKRLRRMEAEKRLEERRRIAELDAGQSDEL